MTLREYFKELLVRSRHREEAAKKEADYAKALKIQGTIDVLEAMYVELNTSELFDMKK